MTIETAVRTRQALHGVAELVLAGPQYRTSGTIRLRVDDGGFGTVRDPMLWVDGIDLIAGETRVPLSGVTVAEIGRAAGVEVGAPEGLYHDHSGLRPDDKVEIDPGAAKQIIDAFGVGAQALLRLAPGEAPVLWPEHFDLGITLDEVNYGISPGDSYLAEPYAYVGPWQSRVGSFWNASFGASRPMRDLGDVEGVLAFFEEGRRQSRIDPKA